MAHHGFRAYFLRVRRGHGQDDVDFSATGSRLDQHFSEVLTKTLSGYVGATLEGIPLLIESTPGTDVRTSKSQETRTRFESVSRENNHISIAVRYGREGDFDVAVGSDSDVTLEDRATTRLYRAEVFLPTHGKTGVLIVETVGATHPTHLITSWPSLLSKREAAATAEQDGASTPWWKLRVEPYADKAQLDRLIASAQNVRLEFRRHALTASGVGTVRDLTLIQEVRTATMKDKVKSLLNAWRDTPGASAVADLGKLVHGSVTPLGFTDGEVVIEDDSGRIHRVKPGTLEEVFVYALGGPDRPPDTNWRDSVSAVVSQIATEKGIQVSW